MIHNIEILPGRGAQMIRSAGSQATLANREGGYALIKLASGEIRRINEECYATIGQVGNTDHMNVSSGKAGRTRWLGRDLHVRGMVMNPIDHPMGGGQGKEQGRRRTPSSHDPGVSSPKASKRAANTSPPTASSSRDVGAKFKTNYGTLLKKARLWSGNCSTRSTR